MMKCWGAGGVYKAPDGMAVAADATDKDIFPHGAKRLANWATGQDKVT